MVSETKIQNFLKLKILIFNFFLECSNFCKNMKIKIYEKKKLKKT